MKRRVQLLIALSTQVLCVLGSLVACSEDTRPTAPVAYAPPGSVGIEARTLITFATECGVSVLCEIAFVSDRDFTGDREIAYGRYDVYLMAATGGSAVRLTGGVTDVNSASLSPDGTRVAIGDGDQIRIVDLADPRSIVVPVTERAFTTVAPAWSPDGTRIAFTLDENGWFDLHVYVVDVDGSNLTRLASGAFPTWSPDGSRIAFNGMDDDGEEIWVMNADGTDQVNITNSPGNDFWPDWSPDGDRIVFTSGGGSNEIYAINADGSGRVNLTNHPSWDGNPQWSPDGSKIAFMSNRTGNGEIFVMNADGSEPVNLTEHPAQDQAPAW
jgi:Tol biopolymer transport system component